MLNKYRNAHSKRKIKARAKRQAKAMVQGAKPSKIIDKCDEFLRDERIDDKPIKVECTRLRKERPLKEGGLGAGGKQAIVRVSVPLC